MSFTPKQARLILDWGKSGRDDLAKAHREAYEKEGHPDHAIVQQFADRLMQIAGGRENPREAPFDAEGFMGRYYGGDNAARERLDGVGRAETAPAPLAEPLPGDDALAELRALSPAAAQEQIKRLQANPEFGKLLTGESDSVALAGWELLNSIAAGTAAAGPVPAASPAPSASAAPAGASAPGAPSTGGALARYQALEAQILADPRHPYRDVKHPDHQAASAEREAAFSAALHDGGGGETT